MIRDISQRDQGLDTLLQVLALSFVFQNNEREESELIIKHVVELQFWNDYNLWYKIMDYYCDINKQDEPQSEETKNKVSKYISGLFSKNGNKQRFSEEIIMKGFQDVEHLLFQLSFPFEMISSILLKISKK